VWAGLYCLPVFGSYEALLAAVPSAEVPQLQDGAVFKHVLTHKDLHLHPIKLEKSTTGRLDIKGQWFDAAAWTKLGLPAPVRKLLQAAA
jgi:A/G-specific adenine glycosylase